MPHSARIPALWEKGTCCVSYERVPGGSAWRFLALCALVARAEAQEYLRGLHRTLRNVPLHHRRCAPRRKPAAADALHDRHGQGRPARRVQHKGRHGVRLHRTGQTRSMGGLQRAGGQRSRSRKRPSLRCAPAPANDPNQPPRTVEEMAKRANQKTAEQIKKANEDMKDQVEIARRQGRRHHQEDVALHRLALHALHRVAWLSSAPQWRRSHSRAWRWASAISDLLISPAISMR